MTENKSDVPSGILIRMQLCQLANITSVCDPLDIPFYDNIAQQYVQYLDQILNRKSL